MENKYKPYLVSICSYPNEAKGGLDRYINSLKENLDSTKFEIVLIGYEPLQNLPDISGFDSYYTFDYFEMPYPGNLYRFKALYEISKDWDPERWIIFTDTYDVMFQAPFPDFSQFRPTEILTAVEGEDWGESSWFPTLQAQVEVPFIENMKNRPIVNAGTWAMTVTMFKKFFEFMVKRSKDYGNHPWSDQPIYNEFLYSGEGVDPIVHDTFCIVLYKNMELGNVKKESNKFYNRSGELFSIVHGNGSSKEYFND